MTERRSRVRVEALQNWNIRGAFVNNIETCAAADAANDWTE